jgi:hypothetical protein
MSILLGAGGGALNVGLGRGEGKPRRPGVVILTLGYKLKAFIDALGIRRATRNVEMVAIVVVIMRRHLVVTVCIAKQLKNVLGNDNRSYGLLCRVVAKDFVDNASDQNRLPICLERIRRFGSDAIGIDFTKFRDVDGRSRCICCTSLSQPMSSPYPTIPEHLPKL